MSQSRHASLVEARSNEGRLEPTQKMRFSVLPRLPLSISANDSLQPCCTPTGTRWASLWSFEFWTNGDASVVRTARQENRAARLDWFSYVHLFQDAVLSRDPGLDARSVQVQALSTADKNPQLWSRSCQAWAPGPCSFEQPWSSARSRCQAENVVFEAANFLW